MPVVDSAWNAYWAGAPATQDGPDRAYLAAVWHSHFTTLLSNGCKLADLACGNGAVIAAALEAARRDRKRIDCTGVDASAAAIDTLVDRFPGVQGIVAGVADIPLPPESFDIVTSQFGLEYAGCDAFAAAARLVRPGGRLLCITHLAQGALYDECRAGLEATRAFVATRFLSRARQAFESGYSVIERGGSVALFERRQRRLKPAIEAAAQVLQREGQDASGGRLAPAFAGVERMYRNMREYRGADVLAWIDAADRELREYMTRMQSMLDAAVDDAALREIVANVTGAGMQLLGSKMLTLPDERQPFARELTFGRD